VPNGVHGWRATQKSSGAAWSLDSAQFAKLWHSVTVVTELNPCNDGVCTTRHAMDWPVPGGCR
jgi:hypothetical protein